MKRRYLSPKEKAVVIERQHRLCACGCGEPIKDQPVIYDHINPLWISGDNSIGNFQALLIPCDKIKTRDDKGVIAHVKRLIRNNDKDAREARRAKKPRIQSRGFDTRFKRKLNGTTVDINA